MFKKILGAVPLIELEGPGAGLQINFEDWRVRAAA